VTAIADRYAESWLDFEDLLDTWEIYQVWNMLQGYERHWDNLHELVVRDLKEIEEHCSTEPNSKSK